jgi:hypothetical protein
MVFLTAPVVTCAENTPLTAPSLLKDDFAIKGLYGTLSGPDANDAYFFKFDSELSDGTTSLKAKTALQLLPSSTLQKMLEDNAVNKTSNYRLWGKITRFENKNYIFPLHFWTLREEEKIAPPDSNEPDQPKTLPEIDEPNDTVKIPEDIMKKLETRKIIQPTQLKKGVELKQDFILADRTGFILKKQLEEKDNKTSCYYFVLDAIGFNLQRGKSTPYPLLPCYALQRANQKKLNELEQVRFKISAVVTQYKGRNYLLLQRAAKVQSHGNFGN